MFRRFTKKRIAVAVSAIAALALAAGAYAYFTSTGTGNSTATVGNPSAYSVSVTPTGSVSLTPQTSTDVSASGGVLQPYTGVVTNNSSGRQQVSSLTANITGVTQKSGVTGTCTTADFSLYSPNGGWTVASGGQSASITSTSSQAADTAGGSDGDSSGLPQDMGAGTTLDFSDIAVYMVDGNYNQNGCQGATVSLSVTAS